MQSYLAKIKNVASESYKLAYGPDQVNSRVLAEMISDLAHNTESALLELQLAKDKPVYILTKAAGLGAVG